MQKPGFLIKSWLGCRNPPRNPVSDSVFLQEFDPKLIQRAYDKLTILVGGVDMAAGRAAINQAKRVKLI